METENSETKLSKELTLGEFIKSNASIMFGLDKRLWRTLKLLFLSPGKLTKEHLAGDINQFTSPTTLYFSCNFLFFLLLPIVNSGNVKLLHFSYNGFVSNEGFHKRLLNADLISSGLSEIIYQTQFDSFITYNQPALIFIIIPFLALFLKLIEYKSKKRIINYTVQAFHFMTYFLLVFLLIASLANILTWLFSGDGFIIATLLIIFLAALLFYLTNSFIIISNNGIVYSLIKSVFFIILFSILLYGYVNLLYFLTILNVG